MNIFKEALKKNKIVFCFGKKEIYLFLEKIVNPKFSKFIPKISFFENKPEDKPIDNFFILFSGSENLAFEEKNGEINILTIDKSVSENAIIYLPIKDFVLPSGFIFIIPPLKFLDNIEEALIFDKDVWSKGISKIMFFDSFPFYESNFVDNIESLSNLSALRNKFYDISILLLKSDRKFGATDFIKEDDEIETIIKKYKEMTENIFLIKLSDDNKRYDFIFKSLSYKDTLFKKSFDTFYKSFKSSENLFDDDYKDYVFDKFFLENIENIDKIYSFELWKEKKTKNIGEFWIKIFNDNLLNEIKKLLDIFFKDLTIRNDILKEGIEKKLSSFYEREFEKLNKFILKELYKEKYPDNLSNVIDSLTFIKETSKFKATFNNAITSFFKEDFKKDIKKLFLEEFEFWDKKIKKIKENNVLIKEKS